MEAKKPNTKLISLGVLVAVVLLVVAVTALNMKEEQGKSDSAEITAAAEDANKDSTPTTLAETTTPAAEAPATTTPADTAVTTPYKEGSYTAEGSYQTPGGTEKIKITLTLSGDGTVTATTAVSEGISPDSKEYQSRFISGYKSQVVGKNIASLSLGNISGSSLTPIGFNKAAVTIKSQATS